MSESPKKIESVETRPDAWKRFEHAVAAAATSGPKHRPAKKPKGAKAPSK